MGLFSNVRCGFLTPTIKKGSEAIGTSLSTEELERARDLGAATYLTAYIHLMSRQLKVDDSDNEAVNIMALDMVDILNLSTQAGWCALMGDRKGLLKVMDNFRSAVETLVNESPHLKDI